jgi:hypothetical protein
MHCREAQSRLNAMLAGETVDSTDAALNQHLAVCSACARQWRAARQMRSMLDQAATEDDAPVKPLSLQRKLVEQRQAVSGALSRWWRRRHQPGLTAGLVGLAAAVLLAAVVPFADYHTVGYDVELDGVSEYLAGDHEQLCDLLFTLDLPDAAVDVSGCDSTCHVLVWDLKSPDEVRLLVRTVSYLSEHRVTSNVTPVVTRTSRTLLDRAQRKLFEG